MAVIMLGGSPPGSEPTSIQSANLQLWFDAAFGVYETDAKTDPCEDADGVVRWYDRKADTFYVVRNSVGATPTYHATGVNGRPMIRFDATDDGMYSAGTSGYQGTSNTGFLVWKPPASATIQRGILFYDGANANWGIYNGTAARIDNYNFDGSQDTVTKSATLDAWMIVTCMNNGTNLYIGVNDTRTASMSSVASGNHVDGDTLYIRSVPAAYVQTDIAEYIHYDIALAESDRQEIERRLAWKYGITIGY